MSCCAAVFGFGRMSLWYCGTPSGDACGFASDRPRPSLLVSFPTRRAERTPRINLPFLDAHLETCAPGQVGESSFAYGFFSSSFSPPLLPPQHAQQVDTGWRHRGEMAGGGGAVFFFPPTAMRRWQSSLFPLLLLPSTGGTIRGLPLPLFPLSRLGEGGSFEGSGRM